MRTCAFNEANAAASVSCKDVELLQPFMLDLLHSILHFFALNATFFGCVCSLAW